MGKVFKALKRADELGTAPGTARPDGLTVPEKFPVPAPVELAEPIEIRREGERQPPLPDKADPNLFLRPGQWDDRLILASSTTGPAAESIRALRTRVLYPTTGRPPRTLLFTSASPGEGKSFICANLAISLAQGLDNYCLLVDCDLRKPTQHLLFGLSNKAGLSDYLQHKKQLSELLVPSGVEKLSLLQAGPRSINPAELLGSAYMTSLIEELARRYDDRVVLLDSPPLHSASETAVLAQLVDGVVLVVRHGASRREYVKALADAIGREKILGVVFNAYKATALDYKVFGYYEYQQNYYYSEK